MSRLRQRLAIAFLCVGGVTAAASDATAALDQLKTAYLFNFAKFVSWPEQPAEIALCIDTRASTGKSISALHGRKVDTNRTLVVRPASASLSGCHMYFGTTKRTVSIGDSAQALTVAAHHAQVLMISDEDGALNSGFAFQFFLETKKLRFAVNAFELEDSGYQISSKLLQLARPLR